MTPRKISLSALAAAPALIAILFTCADVPDFCGSGEIYDPSCQFCYGNRAYQTCKNGKYNPLTAGCDKDTLVGTRCSNDSIVPLGTPCGGYTLTLAPAPESGGAVEAVTPPDNNGLTYIAKRPVTLRAAAADGYKFAGWAGTQPANTNSVDDNNTVTAEYITSGSIPKITIVAVFKPTGKGKLVTDVFPKAPTLGGYVSRDKPQPDDGYTDGERVTVTAAPAPGFAFAGWSGADSSKNNSTVVTMDESKTLVAMFTPVLYTLTAKANPADGGAVFIDGTPFGGAQDVGTDITVWAGANQGYVFTHWTGDGARFKDETDVATYVTLTANASITANFKKDAGGGGWGVPPGTQSLVCTLMVAANPAGGGDVLPNPQGGKYQGGWVYMRGDKVAVSAAPKTGYEFTGWTGDTTGAGSPITIIMYGNKTLTANFRDTTVTVTPPDGGDGDNKCGTDGTAGSCKTTEEIGGRVWMAENLNYRTDNSWCYSNSADSCNKYGRLYTWSAAKAACQSVGWRLPDTADWRRLVEVTGGDTAAKNLKATGGWSNNGNGADKYGFSALPGGIRESDGSFNYAGKNGYWWAATEYGSSYAYRRDMYYNYDFVSEYDGDKNYGFSVRCVKGESTTPTPTYTVKWNADGGTPVPTQTSVNQGEIINAPTAMTKAGYTFGGWYTDSALTTAATFPIANVTGNREFWARWTEDAPVVPTYTLTVSRNPADGGTAGINGNNQTSQSNISAGTAVAIWANPASGYTFNGWSVTSGIGTIDIAGSASATVTVNGNVTVTANFTQTSPPPPLGNAISETVNGYTFEMVPVAAGKFTMGCTEEQGTDCENDESPTHEVTLGGYYIGKYEVTQGLWKAVMGGNNNPSYFTGSDSLPVERVSWNDVQDFITELNKMTVRKYRLPTEAEWEFAARGGQSGGTKYSGSNAIGDVAWYWGNNGSSGSADYGTKPVGTKSANGLGIYDMSGNVLEWVNDWYGSYSSDAQTNPTGPSSEGSGRVRRGGSWNSGAEFCRVSFRSGSDPDDRFYDLGFRLAVSP